MPELTKDTKQIIDGILLIAKYNPHADIAAEHDVLYFGAYECRAEMTPEEQAQMEAWGWIEEYDSWAHYT